jgi:predicted HAD superfamily Cof-like phosphohydrolase
MKQIEQVQEFHKNFMVKSPVFPTMSNLDTRSLRYALLKEELEEYKLAETKEDVLDALVDIAYVLFGTIDQHGMNNIFEDAFDEVHSSNMSKLEDGEPLINGVTISINNDLPFGKILKGKNYKKPNLRKFIE